MLPVTPLPAAGEVFLDTRGGGRVLRVSWHFDRPRLPGAPGAGDPTSDVVVLSLWHGDTCTGSFRLPAEDVPALVSALKDGLARIAGPPADVRPGAAGGLTG